jgi:hypothetical protein
VLTVVGMNTRPEVLTKVGITEDCTKRVTPEFSPLHFFPFPVEVFVPGTSRPVQTHFVLLVIMTIVPLSATREEKKALLSQTLTDFRRRLIELVYKHSDLFDPQGGGGYPHHLNSAFRQTRLMTEGIDLYEQTNKQTVFMFVTFSFCCQCVEFHGKCFLGDFVPETRNVYRFFPCF